MIYESDVIKVVAAMPTNSLVRWWTREASKISDSAAAYQVLAALAALTQTIPPNTAFNFGKPIFPHAYFMAVGPSTLSRKNFALEMCRRVIAAAFPKQLALQPGSPEGLIDSLETQSQQLFIQEEFSALLAQAHRGYLQALKPRWTEIYDGTPISRVRANGKGGDKTIHPRYSMLVGTTPNFLEDYLDAVDFSSGFYARFLIFNTKRERYNPIAGVAEEMDAALVAWLRGYQEPWASMTATPGRCMGFSPEARELWIAWQGTVENMVHQLGPSAQSAVARAPGHALKAATLLSWDYGQARQSDGTPWYVTPAELVPAMAIADWHITSVQEIAEHLAPDFDMRARRRVLMAVNGTPRTLGAIIKDAQVTKRRGKEMIETLQAEGTIVCVNGGAEALYVRAGAEPIPSLLY